LDDNTVNPDFTVRNIYITLVIAGFEPLGKVSSLLRQGSMCVTVYKSTIVHTSNPELFAADDY